MVGFDVFFNGGDAIRWVDVSVHGDGVDGEELSGRR